MNSNTENTFDNVFQIAVTQRQTSNIIQNWVYLNGMSRLIFTLLYTFFL